MNSYANGLVRGINDKFSEYMRARAKANTYRSPTGRDLVVIKNQAVNAYYGKLRLARGRVSESIMSSGYESGRVDGRNIPLHRGVNGGNRTRYLEK